MPTPSKGPRMGGSPAHERHMLSNLAQQLFEHGRITTTEAKAKRLRPYAEHLITFGKRGDLHARRQVLKRLPDKGIVHVLFDEIGPRYVNRPGGYTRIVKLGPRKGDNAPMALIELVEALTVGQRAVGEAERARGTQFAASKAPTGATREAAEDLAAESPTAAAVAVDAASADADANSADVAAAGSAEATAVEDTAVEDTAVEVVAAGDESVPAEAPAPKTAADATTDGETAPAADATETAAKPSTDDTKSSDGA